MRVDGAAFALVLLAAICAENIPLMLALTVVAGVCVCFGKPYRECPHCGAHLDPGEICDCPDAQKETAPGATNTRDGKMEQTTRKSH